MKLIILDYNTIYLLVVPLNFDHAKKHNEWVTCIKSIHKDVDLAFWDYLKRFGAMEYDRHLITQDEYEIWDASEMFYKNLRTPF